MGPSSARLWWCLPGTPIHEGHRLTAYLASERTVVNITFYESPSHSAQTAQLGGLEKISPTIRQHSLLGVDVHPVAAHISTHIQHTHNNEFAPLASPVESRVLRE